MNAAACPECGAVSALPAETPVHYPSCSRALGLRAAKTAEIALQALERITAAVDDSDNPIGLIRSVLEQASAELTAAERTPAPALVACPNCGKPFQPNDGIGGETCCSPLGELERRIERLERPVADRDAVAWEIGRSAGIRGDAESLNPFRVQR